MQIQDIQNIGKSVITKVLMILCLFLISHWKILEGISTQQANLVYIDRDKMPLNFIR